jgi:hypothetical protein
MLVGYITLCGQQVFSELRREARELVIEDEALCWVGLTLRYPRSDSVWHLPTPFFLRLRTVLEG